MCVTVFPLWRLQITALTILGSSGEMVYFFFDHFTWMSRVGLLDSKLAGTLLSPCTFSLYQVLAFSVS